MATPKGTRYGGRAKGKANESTERLREIAKKHNCDPFEVLIMFAAGDYAGLGYSEFETTTGKDGSIYETYTIKPELRAKCAEKACEYIESKRKAVEIRLDDDTKDKLQTYEEYLKSLNKEQG